MNKRKLILPSMLLFLFLAGFVLGSPVINIIGPASTVTDASLEVNITSDSAVLSASFSWDDVNTDNVTLHPSSSTNLSWINTFPIYFPNGENTITGWFGANKTTETFTINSPRTITNTFPTNTTIASPDNVTNIKKININTTTGGYSMQECFYNLDAANNSWTALNSVGTPANETWGATTSNITDGSHSLFTRCFNYTGGILNDNDNSTSSLTYFTYESNYDIDVTYSAPSNNTISSSTSVTVNVTTSLASQVVNLTVNGSYQNESVHGFESLNSAQTSWGIVLSTDGSGNTFTGGNTYTIVVYATDNGNVPQTQSNSEGRVFTIDTTKPTTNTFSKQINVDGSITIEFNYTDINFDYCQAQIFPISDTTQSTVIINGTTNVTNNVNVSRENVCTVNVTPFGSNNTPFTMGEIYIDGVVYDTAGNRNTTASNQTNMTYHYLIDGWNLLGDVYGGDTTLLNMTYKNNFIDNVAWFNNTHNIWKTFVRSSGNLSANNNTNIYSGDGIFVSVNQDTGFFRSITIFDGFNSTSEYINSTNDHRWGLVGNLNNSATLYTKALDGIALYNYSSTRLNVSTKYLSYFNPLNVTHPYRSYVYDRNQSEIENTKIPFGSGLWWHINATSDNVTDQGNNISTAYSNYYYWRLFS